MAAGIEGQARPPNATRVGSFVMAKVGKSHRIAEYVAVLQAVRDRMPPGSHVLGGKLTRRKDVEAALQGVLEEMRSTRIAYEAYLQQVARERAREKALRPLVQAVRDWAVTHLGKTPVVVAAFAIKAGKPGPKTLQAKVTMIERAKATRKLRGTLGPKQRKKIKA